MAFLKTEVVSNPGSILKNIQFKVDGWVNVLTGLGTKNRDKKSSSCVEWQRMSESDAEELFAADAMARKIVELPVKEALANGFVVKGYSDEENEMLQEKVNSFGLVNFFRIAWNDERIYGGAGLVIVTDKFINASRPLEQTEKIVAFNILNRYELVISQEDIQKDLLKSNFGQPEFYTLQPRESLATIGNDKNANTIKIHTSRVVHFGGLRLPRRLRITNGYWGDSVLNALKESIRNYQVSHSSAASVIEDFSVAKFKIKNLADQMASDGDDQVIARMQIMNLTKSIARAVVVDADGEDFVHETRSVAGLPEIISKSETHLVAETNFPHTVLFGNSPSGMGGTGSHETNNWFKYLESEQANHIKPKVLQIVSILAVELKLDPKKLEIVFPPLQVADEKTEVEVRKIQAEIDSLYIQDQVLSPDEVANSRFGSEKYSTETTLENVRTGFEPLAPTNKF